jgi:phosphatidylinositol alpha 1,6-mannosyltransferase
MKPEELRIALFSGNYNYVRDGANQALNRLVGYLLRQGAQVRVYSPVVAHPAFPATGEMVNIKAFKVPTREEYRIPYKLPRSARRDLDAFAPNIIHV